MQKLKFLYNGENRQRVDKFLAENTEYSREFIKKLTAEGNVFVDNRPVKGSYNLNDGDIVGALIPDLRDVNIKPVKMDLDIIYEDDDMLVINKSAGLVVHPGVNGMYADNSLVNGIMYYCGDSLSGIGGEKRPGIVHRLDKDTSGLLIIAKNNQAHTNLMHQFKNRTVEKSYVALVIGTLKHKRGRIESPIGRDIHDRKKTAVVTEDSGKMAMSAYCVLEEINCYSLLKIKIETGRMHQIRVHMSSIGHPVAGDDVYGNVKVNKKLRKECGLKRQFLHSSELTVRHPVSGKIKRFKTDLPNDLKKVLQCF